MTTTQPVRTNESNPFIGRTMGRYRILEEVGRGGMAVVYRGTDEMLGREVAVKVLHPHLAGEPESRARLQREAQAVAKLHHENILEIFDYSGPDQSDSFIITEFIRGQTLTRFLNERGFPMPEVAELVAAEVAGALLHAHGFGVIHRDVKPENVMIRDDGRVKLTDFGIAQIVDKERLTATGQLIGSPAYLAPELVAGGRVDFRTDVFAVGIVLYRMATGQLPFSGRNPHEVMKKIVDGRYTPPDQLNPKVGTALVRIIARTLAREPDGRYPEMGSLRADLLADAAAAGLVDVRGELAQFFADPSAWEKAARPRMIAALVESARRETARGRAAAAMALISRALTLDPANPAARGILDGLGRRRRMIKLGAALAGVAVLGTGGSFGLRQMKRAQAERAAIKVMGAEALARASTSDPAAPRVAGSSSLALSPSGSPSGSPSLSPADSKHPDARLADSRAAHVRSDAPRPKVAPKAAAVLRPDGFPISVDVHPASAQILVDNKDIGWGGPGLPIAMKAGERIVEFRREPYCYPQTVKLGAADRSLARVNLKWRPARLAVSTNPPDPDALVLITTGDGKSISVKGGQPASVVFPAGALDGKQKVYVTVTAPHYKMEYAVVELVAGTLEARSIVLHPLR